MNRVNDTAKLGMNIPVDWCKLISSWQNCRHEVVMSLKQWTDAMQIPNFQNFRCVEWSAPSCENDFFIYFWLSPNASVTWIFLKHIHKLLPYAKALTYKGCKGLKCKCSIFMTVCKSCISATNCSDVVSDQFDSNRLTQKGQAPTSVQLNINQNPTIQLRQHVLQWLVGKWEVWITNWYTLSTKPDFHKPPAKEKEYHESSFWVEKGVLNIPSTCVAEDCNLNESANKAKSLNFEKYFSNPN